jgi:hypothetical protein
MVDSNRTISELFSEAANRLRAEFEFARSTNPHPGEKGAEVEEVLKSFLNSHLPQRFHSGSGYIIDNDNNISKQTDVVIYDALSSPVYRASSKTQIIPADTVAAVIEVKTCLNKTEVKDSFEKILSCKKLRKTPLSKIDQKSTGSNLATVATMGVIFGFDSDTSLKTLGDNLAELNKTCESKLWPDMLIVLDKGVLSYGVSFPGQRQLAGGMAPPCGEDFVIPPMAVYLVAHNDEQFSLNRFFSRLLAHLTFYPHRVSNPPFDVMLADTAKQARIVAPYQYNTKGQLKPSPPEMNIENEPEAPFSMRVDDENGEQLGLMQFIPWQDGSVIRWYGKMPLQALLLLLLPTRKVTIINQPDSPFQLSSLLNVTAEAFRTWPEILAKNSNMIGTLIEVNSKN